ncbi:MAG: EGF domain-containing protein [Bradymonadaceae bacterium]
MSLRHLVLLLCASLVFIACGKDEQPAEEKNNETNPLRTCDDLQCDANEDCDEQADEPVCTCRPGFQREGANCVEVIIECASDDECHPQAACFDDRCRCIDGWRGDGQMCIEPDPCDDFYCSTNAYCQSDDGTPRCVCVEGQNCEPTDFCALPGRCHNPNAECISEPDDFRCECADGYTGDGERCSRLVDCVNDADACHGEATCVQTNDGSACVCGDGLAGDGLECAETGFAKIVAANSRVCGLRASGAMYCWGAFVPSEATAGPVTDFYQPRPLQEPDHETWRDLWVSDHHVCGLRDDQRAYCWLTNKWMPFGDGPWQMLAPHNTKVCGLDMEGEIWCVSSSRLGELHNYDPDEEPTRIDADGPWVDVARFDDMMCAIRDDGSLWCQGNHAFEEWGAADETMTQVATEADWRSVVVAVRGGCGIRGEGRLFCWGTRSAFDGGVTIYRHFIDDDEDWESVSLGSGATCGRKQDGRVLCWGSNLWGERGDDRYETQLTPVEIPGSWTAHSIGRDVACGLDSQGAAHCMGHGYAGQVGTGSTGIHLSPARVTGSGWQSVATGEANMCAIRDGGDLRCTGSNLAGQNGHLVVHTQVPTAVSGSSWTQVSAGPQHTCAVRENGSLWCMGANRDGRLGLGEDARPGPGIHRVGDDDDWQHVAVGGVISCAIKTDRTLWCWGQNTNYQLGLGDEETRFVPTRVGEDDDWRHVSIAPTVREHEEGRACAIKTDDSLWCWGIFYLDGGAHNSVVIDAPQPFGQDSWSQVKVGRQGICGIKTDGTLWCWGFTYREGLAHSDLLTPGDFISLSDDAGWESLSVGYSHTCAIRGGGELWCWGDNALGQLGQGSILLENPTLFPQPRRVESATDWTAVAASANFTCGIRTDDTLWCWGSDRDGQLGLGTAWYTAPQRVVD